MAHPSCQHHASPFYAPWLCLQVMAFSATYTPELLKDLEPLMKRPQQVDGPICLTRVLLSGSVSVRLLCSNRLSPFASHHGVPA